MGRFLPPLILCFSLHFGNALGGLAWSPAFRTFITGAGFFSDSYDLFITDGVTNMLKDLGPVQKVVYSAPGLATNATCYFTALCVHGLLCVPKMFVLNSSWVANPATTWVPEFTPHYQLQTPGLKNAVSNAALIGSITGQISFGFMGDVVGRKWCFVLTTILIIVGCLGSATAAYGIRVPGDTTPAGCWGSAAPQPSGFSQDVYQQLIFWRAILGFGVGGEYPLAGTIASEGAKDTGSRGRAVLYTFSMQGWGKLTASLVNYALVRNLRFFGGVWELDYAWRLALALGCTLNLVTVYFRWSMEESSIFHKSAAAASGAPPLASRERGEPLALELVLVPLPAPPKPEEVVAASRVTLSLLWGHRWTLFGTASTWFLIDVTFYGQSLMNTSIVSEAVVSTAGLNAMEKLRSSLLSTVWIMLIAIPGYWIAIACVDCLGRKRLQRLGFLATSATFLVLGLAYNTPLRSAGGGAGFVFLYGLTYLFSNAGPNSVTFLMPAEAFPTLVRSTAHGISAASGKVGATVGAYGLLELFYALPSMDAGVVAVMVVCAAVALLGAVVNEAFCRETGGWSLEEVDRGFQGGDATSSSSGSSGGAMEAASRDPPALQQTLCVRAMQAFSADDPSRGHEAESDSAPLTPGGKRGKMDPGGYGTYTPWPEPN